MSRGARLCRAASIAVVGLAIAAVLVPLPATAVERYYSSGLFPLMQRAVTDLSNRTSIALVDVFLLAVASWLVWQTVRAIVTARTAGWRRPAMIWLVRVTLAVAVLSLAFFATWGLNYRRVSLIEKVHFDPAEVSPQAANALAIRAVDAINTLFSSAHAGDVMAQPVDPTLARAFADAQDALGVARPARPGRPKRSILDSYFKAAGVAGMTDPYFLETLIVSDLVPFERPHVIAHEWSHLAGFADEGEANFVGWLTCTKGSAAAQYSGWMFLYQEVAAGLRDAERKEVSARLHAGPRADMRAAFERVRRNVRPMVAEAGWQVYDRYLKANRVEAGRDSYREVVRLVLGVRLRPDAVPQVK